MLLGDYDLLFAVVVFQTFLSHRQQYAVAAVNREVTEISVNVIASRK